MENDNLKVKIGIAYQKDEIPIELIAELYHLNSLSLIENLGQYVQDLNRIRHVNWEHAVFNKIQYDFIIAMLGGPPTDLR